MKAGELAEMKEGGKPNEWIEVKKKKGKDIIDAPMVNFVPTPPPSSSNVFDILNTCVVNEEVSFCADLKSVLNANEDILNVEASKEEKEIVGDVGNINGLAPKRSSRPKGAPQSLSDGTFVVPWTNPSSKVEDKKKLLERIANLKLAQEVSLFIKSKKSSCKTPIKS